MSSRNWSLTDWYLTFATAERPRVSLPAAAVQARRGPARPESAIEISRTAATANGFLNCVPGVRVTPGALILRLLRCEIRPSLHASRAGARPSEKEIFLRSFSIRSRRAVLSLAFVRRLASTASSKSGPQHASRCRSIKPAPRRSGRHTRGKGRGKGRRISQVPDAKSAGQHRDV